MQNNILPTHYNLDNDNYNNIDKDLVEYKLQIKTSSQSSDST